MFSLLAFFISSPVLFCFFSYPLSLSLSLHVSNFSSPSVAQGMFSFQRRAKKSCDKVMWVCVWRSGPGLTAMQPRSASVFILLFFFLKKKAGIENRWGNIYIFKEQFIRFYLVIECVMDPALVQNAGVTPYVSRSNVHSVTVSQTMYPDTQILDQHTAVHMACWAMWSSDVKQRSVSLNRTTWDDLSGSSREKKNMPLNEMPSPPNLVLKQDAS